MAELTERYGHGNIDVTLTPGGGGIFDVILDGQKVFSKHETGRFPTYGEVPKSIDTILINK